MAPRRDGDDDRASSDAIRRRLLPPGRRALARRGETASDVTLFFVETLSRASPIALGVVAARVVSDALESFVDAFISPLIALTLGSRGRALREMSFSVLGVDFHFGEFLEQVVEGVATLGLLFLCIRVVATASRRSDHEPLWTPSARCEACKSWIARDALRCPMCRARVASNASGEDDRRLNV